MQVPTVVVDERRTGRACRLGGRHLRIASQPRAGVSRTLSSTIVISEAWRGGALADRPAMPRLLHAAILGALTLPALVPSPAGACSPVTYMIHTLDAAFATDTTAPSGLVASVDIYDANYDPDSGGCTEHVESSCGDLSAVVVTATAQDDRAPSDRIGFRVRVVGGTAPIYLPAEPVRSEIGNGEMRFLTGGEHGFSFDLEIAAVDLNGNLGVPQVIHVEG
jgi:hypothetical protein